jgi:hypothetical protein
VAHHLVLSAPAQAAQMPTWFSTLAHRKTRA